ncbi:Peptidoglycan-binding Lysin subgroup [Penicillium argentinense]|uniref:Peptidoglycan-binding Lysin subgroup n=1 Tax=Penicillium argentinense TaxID=1131581 RepID=A0A9W9KNQ9_9EURO|nr:Peptidoglycan-binding Lysin subgroup [Penicillium argentinense]KAJ5112261.1 Peptidoglycan-binding Lysin subgroup [Penicillium argentinense]
MEGNNERHCTTPADIESYNKDTWAWPGCGQLLQGDFICIGPGDPPMPVALADHFCGPQVPGKCKAEDQLKTSTKRHTGDKSISLFHSNDNQHEDDVNEYQHHKKVHHNQQNDDHIHNNNHKVINQRNPINQTKRRLDNLFLQRTRLRRVEGHNDTTDKCIAVQGCLSTTSTDTGT